MVTSKKLFYMAIFIGLSLFIFGCKTHISSTDIPNNNSSINNPDIIILNYDDIKILLDEKFEDDKNFTSGAFSGTGERTQNKLVYEDNNPSRAPGVIPSDTHHNVYELKSNTFLELKITVEKPSAITFEYKSDMLDSSNVSNGTVDGLSIYIDGVKQPKQYGGNGKEWESETIKISTGSHVIKWDLPFQSYFSSALKNIFCIDNITVVPDGVAYIDINPKGVQETFVGGHKLKFTVKALRADKSVIDNARFTYSVNGSGKINNDGVFTPSSEGNTVINAILKCNDKLKTAEKFDIKVYNQNYLSNPVTIGKYTFKGRKGGSSSSSTENIKFDPPTPTDKNFNADGFFVIKGNTTVPFLIRVNLCKKDGNADPNKVTTFFVRKSGDFYKRIWLRFGKGKYEVLIAEVPELKSNDTQDSRYEGDPKAEAYSYPLSGPKTKKFIINNTSSISEEDAIYLLPSEVVQSDDFLVSNVVNNVTAGINPNNKGDIIRLLHDWELFTHHYDLKSINEYSDRRKKQDAVSVIKYNMGVCEGYANLYAALLRKVGIPTKVICSNALGHAWNQVLYNNKWYLVDVTWDDPIPYGVSADYCDLGEGKINYTYFMTKETDNKHTDPGIADTGRSITLIDTIPSMTGYPDGWY